MNRSGLWTRDLEKPLARQASRMTLRTATLVANGDIWRHSATLSELHSRFLKGLQRSVNRKVQSSNLCPGANFCIQNGGEALARANARVATRVATMSAKAFLRVPGRE